MPDNMTETTVELATSERNAEGQLADILNASGHLVEEQYTQAARLLQEQPQLRDKTLTHLRMRINRLVIGKPDFLSNDEQTDRTVSEAKKGQLVYERFGRMAGEQIRLLRESGQYSSDQLEGFENHIMQKLSWGGNTRTKDLITALSIMGLQEEKQETLLARHLADRALDRYAFNQSAEEDVNLARERLGDNYSTLMRSAIEGIIQERAKPEYREQGLYRPGETPVSLMMNDFNRVSPKLGLAEEDVQAILTTATEASTQ